MPMARQWLIKNNIPTNQLYFIDDYATQDEINGHKVISFNTFIQSKAKIKHVAIAIANSKLREKIATQLEHHQVNPWAIKDDSVIIMDDVKIGPGNLLSPFVLLTSNIRIGKFFHANYYSHVAHDCIIGDFVTFAPGVRCNGNVRIEDHAYIGTGAILRQGTPDKPLTIGQNAVVGMGAVVTKDVPAHTTVVGNPARPLIKS